MGSILGNHTFMFLIYLLLTALFIKLILEKRTYPSGDRNKMLIMALLSFVAAFILNFICHVFLGGVYKMYEMSFFFVLDIKLNYLNFMLFSIVSFEVLYEFYYVKTRLKLPNALPYIKLYATIFANSLIVTKIPILANFLVLSLIAIFFIYTLMAVINEKNNIISY